MAILAIPHVMKSICYKHQIYRFRVFRQSLRLYAKNRAFQDLRDIAEITTGDQQTGNDDITGFFGPSFLPLR